MKKYILVFIAFVFENIALSQWIFSCSNFTGYLHSYSWDVADHLNAAIHDEQHVPLVVVRMFHNKIIESIFWGLKAYVRFFDISFFTCLLSFVGCVGIFLGVWFWIQKKNRLVTLTVVYFGLVSFVETFVHPNSFYLLRVFLIATPLEIISLYGFFQLQKKNKMLASGVLLVGIFVALILLIGYPHDIYTYCVGK